LAESGGADGCDDEKDDDVFHKTLILFDVLKKPTRCVGCL
jgi:hypothetical protein